jgi:hypothetical protein
MRILNPKPDIALGNALFRTKEERKCEEKLVGSGGEGLYTRL